VRVNPDAGFLVTDIDVYALTSTRFLRRLKELPDIPQDWTPAEMKCFIVRGDPTGFGPSEEQLLQANMSPYDGLIKPHMVHDIAIVHTGADEGSDYVYIVLTQSSSMTSKNHVTDTALLVSAAPHYSGKVRARKEALEPENTRALAYI
jgi:hypothetical protein